MIVAVHYKELLTNRLQVGHDIEDDEVVDKVEESRDSPLQVSEQGRGGGTAQVSA